MDTVFFLGVGSFVSGVGVPVLYGITLIAGEVDLFAGLCLFGCNNFFIGIRNFGLRELIILSLICCSCASSIPTTSDFLPESAFSATFFSLFLLKEFFSSSSSLYTT